MEYEWDEEKRLANIRKHGVDFLRARLIFKGPTLERLDDREGYGEERVIVLGLAMNTVYGVVYIIRESRVRVISAQKAGKEEQKIYYSAIFPQ